MPPKIFLDYDSAELDRQYNQRAWAENAVEIIDRYGSESDAVRARIGEPIAHHYGSSTAETLDVYRTESGNAPIQVFIHGGAWRLLSKRESAFAAELFVKSGAHFIALDFALLPHISLREMVAQVRRATAWIYGNAKSFGGDSGRIYLCGHSSGGHLAANVIVTDWTDQFGLPNDVVKGAICASGIYDLRPVRLSARSSYVLLDDTSEHELSPQRHLDRLKCPLVVAHGEFESDEFKRQAREFAGKASRNSQDVQLIECMGHNHFEVAETLGRRDGLLGQIALRQMRLSLPAL